jgi:hypothetical protein
VALPMQTVSLTAEPGHPAPDEARYASVELGSDLPADAYQSLECLMRQALTVPGAAGALLEAFAVQTRALRMVQEADARGAASLPAEVRSRLAAAAARTPLWLTVAGAGVRG